MSGTQSDIHIRDAQTDERAAIHELTLAAYEEYATIMSPTAWGGLKQAVLSGLSTEEAVERIVAEQNGALVGSVQLYPPSANAYSGAVAGINWPEVRLLAVLPEARGQGIGTALMNECIRRARTAGASALGLHTSESLQVAIRMYKQMGFVRAPEYDFHPEGGEVVEAYRLDIN